MTNIIVLVIAFSIVIFIIVYSVILLTGDTFHIKIAKNVTIRQNGINITLTSEEYKKYLEDKKRKLELENKIEKEKRQREIDIFYQKNDILNHHIQSTLNSCNDILTKKVLQSIMEIAPETEEALSTKEWLYNNGNLRSNEEVSMHEKEIYNAKHKDEYDSERHFVTLLSTIIAFFMVFGLSILALPADLEELRIVIALVLGLIGSLIGSALGHTINISNAENYGIPSSHPSVKKEKLARGLDIAGASISAVSVIKNTKMAAKDVANVDGWKEMQ